MTQLVQGNLDLRGSAIAHVRLATAAMVLSLGEVTRAVTVADPQLLYVTATHANGCVLTLPDATTVALGFTQLVECAAASTGSVSVQDSAAGSLATIATSGLNKFTLIGNATAAGAWIVQNLKGAGSTEPFSLPIALVDWVDGGATFSITIPAATHGQAMPRAQVYIEDGANFRPVLTDVRVGTTDEVILTVNAGSTFAGKVVIL